MGDSSRRISAGVEPWKTKRSRSRRVVEGEQGVTRATIRMAAVWYSGEMCLSRNPLAG